MASPKVGHNGGPEFYTDCGWVAIARAMRKHPLVGFHLHVKPRDANSGAMQPALAWIDLIMECRYAPGEVTNNGKKMQLQRGQLAGATSWLAERWNWTPKTVRTWLDRLEEAGMISFNFPEESKGGLEGRSTDRSNGELEGRSKGRFANIITLCNYDEYQLGQRAKGQVEGQVAGQVDGQVAGTEKGRLAYIENARAVTKEQDNKETTHTHTGAQANSPPAQLEPNTITKPQPALAPDAARDGEDAVGQGVFVNCDTVRHRSFSISIEAIALQLATCNLGLSANEGRDLARKSAIAHALQWATEINNGKLSRDVVPNNTANFIRGSLVNQRAKAKSATSLSKSPSYLQRY